jgi:hypothetical protein
LAGYAQFDSVIRRDAAALSAKANAAEDSKNWIPNREQMGRLYRHLRTCPRWQGTLEQLFHLIRDDTMTYTRLRLALQILHQSGLVTVQDLGEVLSIAINPSEGKVDLQLTPVMQYLHEISGFRE